MISMISPRYRCPLQVAPLAPDAGAAAIADSARLLDTEVDQLWRLDTSILRRAPFPAAPLLSLWSPQQLLPGHSCSFHATSADA